MYDYANLPALVPVMDRILGYLSVKERIKAKSVCRSWRAEIERRERKRDILVLHLGPYPWNIRWTEANNQRLMKFENSFEVKRLTFLKHPMTRALLNKIKKLAILHHYGTLNPENSTIEPYLSYFQHCEEIEIRDLWIESKLTFDLPKLRVLVLNRSAVDTLVLNCPSLEVLYSNRIIEELRFKSPKKLKRLICFGWPETVSLKPFGQFSSLKCLIFCTDYHVGVDDHLLDLMPKLKRFVLHSEYRKTNLETIRRQQKRLGLKNLEILLSGFRDLVEVTPSRDGYPVTTNDRNSELFENYSKLEESSLWDITVDYPKLFDKFKILPSNFFERFPELTAIEITQVTNYTHLFGFLKCCPFVEQLSIHLNSKVDANLILCQMMPLLHPSLKQVTIVAECASDVLEMDFAFLRLFNLISLRFNSTRIPINFLRKVAVRRGAHLQNVQFLEFEGVVMPHCISIYFNSQYLELVDHNCHRCGPGLLFASMEKLISHLLNDPHLRSFLI